MENKIKTPVGCVPRCLWLDDRIKDLLGAINRRVEAGIIDAFLIDWIKELSIRVEEVNQLSKGEGD